MVKCAKCVKLITKKSPGLQCSKCSKWLHAACVSITADQLSVLHDTESVDWKCKNCSAGAKPRRLSCIMPEIDGDENTDTESAPTNAGAYADITMQQILRDLRREVRQVIQEELQRTLKFYSEKIDEYEHKIIKYEKTTKELENKCYDLQNQMKNSNLKFEVLESKINQMEQAQLCNQLEICGINTPETENLLEIAKKVAVVIRQNPDDVAKAYKKRRNPANVTRQKDMSTITVVLREGSRDQWIDAAKQTGISAESLGYNGDNKIYLRESLSPATAFLLWKTKEELKGLCSYIWCKHGNILVRKSEREKKITTIRSIADIDKVKASHDQQ